jgi:site-specific DNA recombinase
MRVALYFRVSTEEQKERASIETQRDFASHYCKAHDVLVVDAYSDDGISGTVPVGQRPGGAKLLADAKARRFDCVLVYKLDRLARSTLEILKVVELLGDCGVTVKSMTEPFETDSSVGKFLVSMLASVAQLERDAIRDRVQAGLERGARQGRWLGGRPSLGFHVVDKKLAIHPEQAAVVRRIFEMYLGGHRMAAIARQFNAEGVTTPKGWYTPDQPGLWYEGTVSKILRDPLYSGTFTWRKTTGRRRKGHRRDSAPESKQIVITVPAIISLDDFEEVQRRVQANTTLSIRNVKNFYLLRSLIRCGTCGRRYVGYSCKNGRHKYYRCGSHFQRIGVTRCKGGNAVRVDVLDARIWRDCAAFIRNPHVVLDEVREAMRDSQRSQDDMHLRIEKVDALLRTKLSERARVINLVRRDLISEFEAELELRRLALEVMQLEGERKALEQGQETAEALEMRILSAESMLTLMRDRVARADDATKREIVLALVDSITIETIGEGRNAEVRAIARYAFDPSPAQAMPGGVIDYLTAA